MAISRRAILIRFAAIACGLAPFLLAELFFTWVGWGRPDDHVDPFVGFRNTRPLFVLNEAGTDYEIPKGRQLCFRPESFSAKKSTDDFRIFCLGGSTVQGRPYAIETSFTTWLELSLQSADPPRQWEVVNCGGISYASYRLAPILEEILDYEPDLVILYTGHNEFLEDRTYRHIKQRSEITNKALETASRLRTFNVVRAAILDEDPAVQDPAIELPEEVEARLDYRGGLDKYVRDPVWHAGVVEHFRLNLRRMIAICERTGVLVWIVDPVSNLRSCPPFKASHREDLDDVAFQRWHELRTGAAEHYRDNMPLALDMLKQAAAIDDQHAGLWYDLGKSYEAIGQYDLAATAYRQSRDLDLCPLRMVEPLYAALVDVAESTGTPVIPVRQLFEARCEHGIPGGFLLVDHVHPSITGHQMIAELLMDQMASEAILVPQSDWQTDRDARYQTHMESLDDKYYIEGQRRLRGLQSWAQGRATQVRGEIDGSGTPNTAENDCQP